MSSHKGPGGAQGSGAPASTRDTDTVELAELGPLLEEKGKRGIANPTKVSCLPRRRSLDQNPCVCVVQGLGPSRQEGSECPRRPRRSLLKLWDKHLLSRGSLFPLSSLRPQCFPQGLKSARRSANICMREGG